MAKFTGGDWHAEQHNNGSHWFVESGYGDDAITVVDELDEADARLIARAPKMYAILKELADFCYGYSGDDSRVTSEWYLRFKEKYLKAYDILAEIDGKEEKKG